MNTAKKTDTTEKQVVILGGGFGGLAAATGLANRRGIQVTLIDSKNHHLFQPLLYQVATAGLNPADIAVPLRGLLSGAKNVQILLDRATSVDGDYVLLSDGRKIHFDYLVVATGAEHSYFGHNDWEPFAPGLKTLEQATEIRRKILLAFEEAEKCSDNIDERRAWMTFVIVGGGPTGLELAGAIAEIRNKTLARDFRNIQTQDARILLIEAGTRIMAMFDPSLSDKAKKSLEEMKVDVLLQSRVENVNANGVVVNGAFVPAKTVIWAAGVQASPLAKTFTTHLDRVGRVIVRADCSLENRPNIFVIGDLAAFTGVSGKTLPGLAPVALQQGRFVAKTLLRETRGQKRGTFHYFDKGMMATIGRHRAILQVGKLKMSGPIAWLAWLFIHIMYLVNYRNRLFVLIEWAWSYVTFGRGARLILGRTSTSKDE